MPKNPQRLRSSTENWPKPRPSKWGRINSVVQRAWEHDNRKVVEIDGAPCFVFVNQSSLVKAR